MRIALLSDIHGNLPALEAVVADFTRRGVDHVANLGDSFSGPLLPLETTRYLMGQAWTHLAGNHERQVLTEPPAEQNPSDAFASARLGHAELEWAASLPSSLAFGARVHLCHGIPSSDIRYLLETIEPLGARAATPDEVASRLGGVEAELVACGHSHVPRSVRLPDGRVVVNPGSVGLPAFDAHHPYPHVAESGSPDAHYAVAERTASGWTVSLITVPYDHKAAARLAEAHGRDDWAYSLRTGLAPRAG